MYDLNKMYGKPLSRKATVTLLVTTALGLFALLGLKMSEFSKNDQIQQIPEGWSDVEKGDLIRWRVNDQIQIVANVVPDSGIRLVDFSSNPATPIFNLPINRYPELIDRVTLIKRGEDPDNPRPEYLAALDEFIQQQFGRRGE